MKKYLIILPLALQTIAAKATDTLVVSTTPVMHCASCENKIKKNIRFVKGTKRIVTDIPRQTVTILFDGKKSSSKDYEAAFRKIGYEMIVKVPKDKNILSQ